MNIKVCAVVIQLAVLYMVIPQASGWWFIKEVAKHFCGFFWEYACPAGVAAGGAAAAVGSAGTGAAVAAAGVVAGTSACHLVKKSTCKRTSITDLAGAEEYAFPDEFEDYDMNRDGQIEYEEFAFTLMSLLPMEQPEEIRGPFDDVDINRNGRIDSDEWEKAPLIFRHPTDAGIESLRVDDRLETQLPEKRFYGYYGGYRGYRK